MLGEESLAGVSEPGSYPLSGPFDFPHHQTAGLHPFPLFLQSKDVDLLVNWLDLPAV